MVVNKKTRHHNYNGARLRRSVAGLLVMLGSAFAHGGPTADFTGTWSVAWCDKARPGNDCGGFMVHLLQQGSKLCGTHSGATPNLSRLDEGGDQSIVGTVMEDTAVLTIRSGRNDSIHLVTARRQSGALDWELSDTVLKSDSDTEIIPTKERLSKATAATHAQGFGGMQQACLARWQTAR
ncbi:MAG TPA: hypothetical protein VFY22_03535 [Hydrogenophaga sp.]|nr:hypothetical protein [Hydrogenophaga sp.]